MTRTKKRISILTVIAVILVLSIALVGCRMEDDIASNGENIAQLQNDLSALDTKVTGVETTLNGSIDALKTSLEEADATLTATLNKKIEDADAALRSLIAEADADLADDIKDATDALAAAKEALETSDDALADALAAAKEALENADKALGKSLDDAIAAIDEAIAACALKTELTAEINAIKGEAFDIIAGQSDLKGLDTRIAELIARLDTIFNNYNGIIEMEIEEEQVTVDVKEAKSNLVARLTMVYTDFDERIDDYYGTAITTLKEEANMTDENARNFMNSVMDEIYTSYDHEMFAFLQKGTSLIILSNDVEQAIAYEKEYEERINSFDYYAQFAVIKAVKRYTITTYEIPDSLQHPLKSSVLDSFDNVIYYQNDANALHSSEEIKAYFDAKVAEIELWRYRAESLEEIYDYLDECKYAVNHLDPSYIEDEKAYIIGELEAIINDNDYLIAEAAYIDTTVEPNEEVDPLADLVAEDKAAMDIFVEQATKYNELLKYEKDTIIPGINDLAHVTGEDKNTAKDGVQDISSFDNYKVLETIEAINAQYAADIEKMDVIAYKMENFSAAETYAYNTIAAFGITYDGDYIDEKALVIERINDVSVLNPYYTAVAVVDEENAENNKDVRTVIDEMLAADKIKVDVLNQRLATYKALYDYATAQGTTVNNLTTGHTCATEGHGVFTATDKLNFINEFAGYIFDFDTNVDAKAFATVADVQTYESKVKGAFDIGVYRATTFKNILKNVADAEDYIDALTNINAINENTAATFKARIHDYSTYANYVVDTADYVVTADDYVAANVETYQGNYNTYKTNVDTLVADTRTIAEYERDIIKAYLDSKQSVTDSTISADQKTYLENVLDSIYNTNTNLAVTDTTVAETNASNAETQAAAVSDAIDTFIDFKADQTDLNTRIEGYIATKYTNFENAFYEAYYKDSVAVWNRYFNNTPYNNTIQKADELEGTVAEPVIAKTISQKVTEVTAFDIDLLTDTLPTVFDYTTFSANITYIEEQDFDQRFNDLRVWMEGDDEAEEPVEGVYDMMSASYQDLESHRLPKAKIVFRSLLDNEFNSYNADEQASLNAVYSAAKSNIANAATTAKVIENYNNAIAQFDAILNP